MTVALQRKRSVCRVIWPRNFAQNDFGCLVGYSDPRRVISAIQMPVLIMLLQAERLVSRKSQTDGNIYTASKSPHAIGIVWPIRLKTSSQNALTYLTTRALSSWTSMTQSQSIGFIYLFIYLFIFFLFSQSLSQSLSQSVAEWVTVSQSMTE